VTIPAVRVSTPTARAPATVVTAPSSPTATINRIVTTIGVHAWSDVHMPAWVRVGALLSITFVAVTTLDAAPTSWNVEVATGEREHRGEEQHRAY
jgi:hypothetical protein